MTNPISEECAAIAARERRDEVLDALACALMDADRIHQPGACICRRDDGFTVQLQPGVEYPHAVEVDGNPVGVSKGARLALLHALGGVPAEDRAPEGPSGSVPAAEPEPVLDRDGVPIEAGDVVWDDNGLNWLVTGTRRHRGGYIVAVTAHGAATARKPESLTHQRPDSWERLKNDAQKELIDYWSCRGIKCIDCPAMVDGKNPVDRYGTAGCGLAMRADIVARAKALAGAS